MEWSRRCFLRYCAAAGIAGVGVAALGGCAKRFLDESILHAPAQGDAGSPKRPLRFMIRDDLEGAKGGSLDAAPKPMLSLAQLSDVHITLEGFSITGHPALEKLMDGFGDSIGFGGLDRPEVMERFDVDVLRAIIKTLNAGSKDIDLVINTGDSVDIGTVRELVAFLTEMNHLNIPWFQTIGNHDRLALGNIPSRMVESYSGMDFLDKNAFIEKHFPTGRDVAGTAYGSKAKGFDFSPRSVVDPRVRLGYYSFTAIPPVHGGVGRPGIKFIVLDTSRSEGSARGQISDEQLRWLKVQLDGLKNHLGIVVSHHPIPQIKDNRDRLLELLLSQPKVIALLCGHDHENRIRPYKSRYGAGFWQIQTSSLMDFPQQARILEFYLNNDGRGVIRTFVFNQEAGGSLGENARASYAAASRERFIGTGKEEDRNCDLLFSISARMA